VKADFTRLRGRSRNCHLEIKLLPTWILMPMKTNRYGAAQARKVKR
jgi:hypothetical protein